MGLIRKTLAVGTLGTVKGSSKKQRVAKQTQEAIVATGVGQARVMAASAATPEARIAALEFEQSVLPPYGKCGYRQRNRRAEIRRELEELRRR